MTQPDPPHEDSQVSHLHEHGPATNRDETLRERASSMVRAQLTDEQVDRSIMYSDAEIRLEIWRHVLELRAAARATVRRPLGRDDVKADEVRAELARREAADEPSGYDSLARHFHASPATIRRRLGKIGKKKTG